MAKNKQSDVAAGGTSRTEQERTQSAAEVRTPNPEPSLGLDDQALSEAAHGDDVPPLVQRGRSGDDGRPYCPRHNVLMRAYSSKPGATHYKCPVDGCCETAKRVRPTLKVPDQPQLCPQRHCRGGDGEPAALEVVQRLSTLAQLHMRCPRCGFHVNVPRPQFDAVLKRERRLAAVEDLADR